VEQVLKSYLEHLCGADCVEENVSMATRTTFKIGGEARYFVTVKSKNILARLVSALDFINYPYRVIGAGANLLVRDKGFDGVIIKLGFSEILDNECFVYADAGVGLAKLLSYARKRGLGGLEFLSGIPGTVGGAVFMNAGAHGGAISDYIAIVDVLKNGEIVSMDARACKFAYRKSIFQSKRELVIIGAYFFLKKSDFAIISEREKEILKKRRISQPKEPSAGSVFRRPLNSQLSVGEMVEQLGLKGLMRGGAQISPVHGGFIVNMGGATASDVLYLVKVIKREIYKNYNLKLKLEIEII